MNNILTINSANGSKLVSVETATRIAADLAAGDPEWVYSVEDYGNGFARVSITDENGDFVAFAE